MTLSDLKKITHPIFYVTPDLTRALGLEDVLPNYHIVTIDDSPLIDLLLKRKVKVISVERETGQKDIIFRSTSQLLKQPKVLSYIKRYSGVKTPNILFFKPSLAIDRICESRGYNKLGNSAFLNKFFEDKILFARFLEKNGLPQPAGEIGELSNLQFGNLAQKYGPKLIFQFGRGWAGSTTFLVENEEELARLKQKYSMVTVKVARFIKGFTVLNNACISGQKVLIGPPATQITAPAGFTSRILGTCGRAWPAKITYQQKEEIYQLTQTVGNQMKKLGYRGFFGLDFLIEEKTGQVFISENNARLTASTPFYTKLELLAKEMPLLAFHILEFLKISHPVKRRDKSLKMGTEVVLRNTNRVPVKVFGNFVSGVYDFGQRKLTFLRPGITAADLKTKKEILVTTATPGRIVGPEIEYIKINSLDCLLTANNELRDWVIDLGQRVKNRLKLQKVENG